MHTIPSTIWMNPNWRLAKSAMGKERIYEYEIFFWSLYRSLYPHYNSFIRWSQKEIILIEGNHVQHHIRSTLITLNNFVSFITSLFNRKLLSGEQCAESVTGNTSSTSSSKPAIDSTTNTGRGLLGQWRFCTVPTRSCRRIRLEVDEGLSFFF